MSLKDFSSTGFQSYILASETGPIELITNLCKIVSSQWTTGTMIEVILKLESTNPFIPNGVKGSHSSVREINPLT